MMVARSEAEAASARAVTASSSTAVPASASRASDAFSAASPDSGGSIRQTCSSAGTRSRNPSMTRS